MGLWSGFKGLWQDSGVLSTEFYTVSTSRSSDTQIGKSDIVTSVAQWLAKAVIQTAPQMTKGEANNLLRMIERPSTKYNGKNMRAAVTIDLAIRGDSFVRILVNSRNKPVGLMWLPSVDDHEIRNKFAGYKYIGADNSTVIVPEEHMMVFKQGLNPDNTRRGISPLRNLLAEVLTDQEAAAFTHVTLKNMPAAGMIIGPKEGTFSAKDKASYKKLEEGFQQHFTGNNRGKASLVTHAFEIGYIQPDMNKIDLAKLREIPEERICAAQGVQPAVVSLGAGLQTTKVGATMIEMTRQSWRYGALPLIGIIEDTINEQLIEKYAPGAVFELSVAGIDDLRMPIVDIIKLFETGIISKEKAMSMAGVEDNVPIR